MITALLHPGISRLACVETDEVGVGVTVAEFAVVRDGARLGDGVVVHPHAVIEDGVVIERDTEIFPGAFIGKEPKGAGAVARQPQFERRLLVGERCSIGPNVVLYFDVEIGRGTLLGDGASIREGSRIGAGCLIGRYVTVNYETVVGERTKIMDLTHITGKSRIGSDVFVSVMVGTTNDNALGAHGYQDELMRGPVIESGAMVGVGASLLPGVVVGEGAVVGAGAVVTRNVARKTLVAGVPATPRRSS
jgi:acetyltransferase-like isoleucine patch superfamily enzyme